MHKPGVILVNIGSPASPAVADVRRFLGEFLMDGRVIDLPFLVRLFLVRCLILPIRAPKTAAAYARIWTAEGSPLVATSTRLKTALQQQLGFTVELAMRYGRPSIASAVAKLASGGVTDLLLVPLFPHYAMSTYETVVVAVREVVTRCVPGARLTVLPPFYARTEYINALTTVARENSTQTAEHVLLSFHSLPERHLRKTDPTGTHCLARTDCCTVPSPAHATCYKHQCLITAEAFVKACGLAPQKYSIAFQCQFGPGRWLGPPTVGELRRLAGAGIKKIAVVCPSFVTDCIETIEEIGIGARAEFMSAGGSEFTLVPCLNDHPVWVKALATMIKQMLEHNSGA